MQSTLSLQDRYDIHELVNRYGHLIDNREFDRLAEIFSDDAVFDLVGLPGGRCEGLPAIIRMMEESTSHPLAHHATNTVIDTDGEVVRILSKGIGVGYKGRVGSVVYEDVVVQTPGGWRIAERLCSLREPPAG